MTTEPRPASSEARLVIDHRTASSAASRRRAPTADRRLELPADQPGPMLGKLV
jgi:hypothetical protein